VDIVLRYRLVFNLSYNKLVILNIYKEKNWTSFDVVAKVRGILGEKKVGHAGTLDPLAEGVLVVLTGKDTKKQSTFMKMEKEYVAEIALGFDSDTYDLESDLRFVGIPRSDLRSDLDKYIGKIKQTVPPYSAVKVKGQRLYKKARSGNINKDELPVKEIEIYSIDVLEQGETEIGSRVVPTAKLIIRCGSGTYIRSLAHDLGGVLTGLVRTKVGEYKVENAVRVSELERKRS